MIVRNKPGSKQKPMVAEAGIKSATHHALVGHYQRKVNRHDGEVAALKIHQEQAKKALEKAQAKRAQAAAKLAHHTEKAAQHSKPKPPAGHPVPAPHPAVTPAHPAATAADMMDAALRKEALAQRR